MCPAETQDGRERGYIIPIGGAEEKLHDPEILDRFVDVCGGKSARIGIIPTASELEDTGRKWHLLVNFRDCRVWPEAWVAFAHRGKKAAVNYAIDTVRYAAPARTEAGLAVEAGGGPPDAAHYPTREAALAHIAAVRAGDRPAKPEAI